MRERWYIRNPDKPWEYKEVSKKEAINSGVYLWDYDETTNSNYEIDEISTSDIKDYISSYIY